MEFALQLLLVLFLVLVNGYFVAAEFALVSLRKTRIHELIKKGNRAAKLVQKAQKDLDSYLSSTQLGITLASLALGWVGEPTLAHFFEPYFSFLPHTYAFLSSHGLATIVAFAIITYLHIILGEIVPKSIAIQKSEGTALFIILPLIIFTTVFKPFIWFLDASGRFLLKICGFVPTTSPNVHSEDEIQMILKESAEQGAIEKEEAEMVRKIFRLSDIPVKYVMVPRTDIIAFKANTELKNVVKKLKRSLHSRFPVYDTTIDSIIGFIHIKDIYNEILETNDNKKLIDTRLIRDVIYVPETKRADDVLLDMRKKHVHMAIVQDEYGGTSGIVTLEDIVESIVGEIQDEFDNPLQEIEKISDKKYRIDGRVELEKMRSKFHLPIKGQGYTTIGGLVFGILGREPKEGNKVQIGNMTLTVEKIERKRISQLMLTLQDKRNKME